MHARLHRGFVRLAASGIGLVACVVFGCDSEPPADDPPLPSADQLERLRALGYERWEEGADRALRGVTRFERERVGEGFNLYTNDVDTIRLIDLEGRFVHEWTVPDAVLGDGVRHCEDATLLADGRLLVVCTQTALAILDRDSNVLFAANGPFHHDAAMLGAETVLAISALPARRYRRRMVIFDALSKLAPTGVERVWSTWEAVGEIAEHHPQSRLAKSRPPTEAETDELYDHHHLNSLQILPDTELGRRDPRFRAGNWLVCLRNVDLVAVLDQDDRHIAWAWGPGELDYPHMPRLLDNGNILIFDNGTHRGTSRVIELDPVSETLVWQYPAASDEAFFSKFRGAVQRLENGNTLITESERGRVIEVTTEGDVVWEFWNPELDGDRRKRIYRMHRVPRDVVDALRRKR